MSDNGAAHWETLVTMFDGELSTALRPFTAEQQLWQLTVSFGMTSTMSGGQFSVDLSGLSCGGGGVTVGQMSADSDSPWLQQCVLTSAWLTGEAHNHCVFSCPIPSVTDHVVITYILNYLAWEHPDPSDVIVYQVARDTADNGAASP